MALAVVVACEVERQLLLFFGIVGGLEAGFAVVLERADEHPVADVPEARDAGSRAIEIAPPPPGISFEEPRVSPNGRSHRRVEPHVVERLFHLARVAAVPLGPHLSKGQIRHRSAGRAHLGTEIGEACPRLHRVATGPRGPARDERDEHGEREGSDRNRPGACRADPGGKREGGKMRRARQAGRDFRAPPRVPSSSAAARLDPPVRGSWRANSRAGAEYSHRDVRWATAPDRAICELP